MSNVINLLNLYKKETEKLIESIEKENIDCIDDMFNKREELINQMKDYDLKEFKQFFIENILPLDNKLKECIETKKSYFKEELLKIKKQKNANKAYNKNFYNNSILNKKI